jgi:putative ABC transport system permease protein
MMALLTDLRFAFRSIINARQLAFFSCLSVGFGVGTTVLVASVYRTVILDALPFPDSERLVRVEYARNRVPAFGPVSEPAARLIATQSKPFERVAYYASPDVLVAMFEGGAESVPAVRVSPDFFTALGMPPLHGRYLSPVDWDASAGNAVVLSHRFWTQSFGADPAAVGTSLRLNDNIYTIVGVMPRSFGFPEPFVRLWLTDVDARLSGADAHKLHNRWVVGRLRPGVTSTQARSVLSEISAQLKALWPTDYEELTFSVTPAIDHAVASARRVMTMMWAAVLCVLVISCVNFASLLLVHYMSRRDVIALRLALGATTGRVFQLLIAESLLLATIGAVLAIAIAAGGTELVRKLGPASVPRLEYLTVDHYSIILSIGLALVSALIAAIVPAIRSIRRNPASDIVSRRLAARDSHQANLGFQDISCTVQIAAAIALSIGAGLLVLSLYRLQTVPLGFNPSNVVVVHFTSPTNPRAAVASGTAFLEIVKTMPQVSDAALTDVPPLSGAFPVRPLRIETSFHEWKSTPLVPFRGVSAAYFKTMQIPLVRGREFSPEDRVGAPCSVVVNQTAEQTFWPGRSALGQRVDLNDEGADAYLCDVVGVVADARVDRPDLVTQSELYFSSLQFSAMSQFIVVRTKTDASAAKRTILSRAIEVAGTPRGAIAWELDRSLRGSWREARFRTVFLTLVAGLSILLAVLGVYGVTDHAARQRIHEIGVRFALGASPRQVLPVLVRRMVVASFVGMSIGIFLAFIVQGILEGFLFETDSTSPIVFLVAPLLVCGVTVAASVLPAARATRTDPRILLNQ